ncbi:GTPase LSG1-2-like [Macadamia integrifolia]|uniref:GTPase LSG1-2-like n=1 Tax=Macadamia integrifolia TaxID=60698 RepID=UPI001C4E9F4E|nr:GTPase LSG1-2-like [Macadamia integrifolia]
MGKNEKTGLGRALVRHHNQMIQQSKEKGRFYRNQQKRVLESVTEVTDIDAVIEQAEEADRLYSVENPVPNLLIDLDAKPGMTPEERREQQKIEEALYASSLQVPRRPPWNAGMSVEELDDNERQAFLTWRRCLARLEENEKLVLTPFEKNLDIWRQLWRVLERSDLLVMVVDARDPLFYRCPDLEAYAREIDEHKRTLLLVNKADLLPYAVRKKWAEYFHLHGILFLFWSAKAASVALEGKKLSGLWEKQSREAVQVVANRVPRHAIETVYNITLPKPKPYELQSRPPLASELLRAFCSSRGYVASSGLPDETRAARLILKDYIDGKLPHFEMPNVTSDEDTKDLDAAEPSSSAASESNSSEDEDHSHDEESNSNLEHVLDDLNSFDLSNGLAPTKAAVVKKKPSAAPHKQHKKPQKKKDRSWRVVNDGGDGMPVVRVFQKTVNVGPLRAG